MIGTAEKSFFQILFALVVVRTSLEQAGEVPAVFRAHRAQSRALAREGLVRRFTVVITEACKVNQRHDAFDHRFET